MPSLWRTLRVRGGSTTISKTGCLSGHQDCSGQGHDSGPAHPQGILPTDNNN